MALSTLQVYSEFAYTAMTEVLDQQINLFNAASDGCIVLRASAHMGDFSDTVFYAKIAGLIRRRNAYGTGTVGQKVLAHLTETTVKVAAGTPEILLTPSQWTWIQRSPEEAGVVLGQQLAGDMMQDMLNTAIGATVTAMAQSTAIVTDATANAAAADKLTSFQNFTKAAGKMGDRSASIRAWVMHSKPMTDLYLNAINNVERLFTFENLNVMRDSFGRLIVVTDSPALVNGGGASYNTLGLKPAAVTIGQNNDWDHMETERTGGENLQRTWQAEWTYQLGVAGYSWDKASGGKSPNDAALFTAANWDQDVTSFKDLPGVLLKTL